jgi:hypothetical protein
MANVSVGSGASFVGNDVAPRMSVAPQKRRLIARICSGC